MRLRELIGNLLICAHEVDPDVQVIDVYGNPHSIGSVKDGDGHIEIRMDWS